MEAESRHAEHGSTGLLVRPRAIMAPRRTRARRLNCPTSFAYVHAWQIRAIDAAIRRLCSTAHDSCGDMPQRSVFGAGAPNAWKSVRPPRVYAFASRTRCSGSAKVETVFFAPLTNAVHGRTERTGQEMGPEPTSSHQLAARTAVSDQPWRHRQNLGRTSTRSPCMRWSSAADVRHGYRSRAPAKSLLPHRVVFEVTSWIFPGQKTSAANSTRR